MLIFKDLIFCFISRRLECNIFIYLFACLFSRKGSYFCKFLLSVVKSTADLFTKRTTDKFVGPIRHPDFFSF